MLPEYMVQQIADSGIGRPDRGVHRGERLRHVGRSSPGRCARTRPRACSGRCRSTSATPSSTTTRRLFEAAGLDPDDPPVTLDELRAASQAIVDAGAAATGIAFDSGVDSGGGWFLEQWFARAGEPYADNGNGRSGAGDAGALRRPVGRRADDRGAVDDRRRAWP